MDKALVEYDYLVGNQLTIADIALYAYTTCRGEGGFDLIIPKYSSMVSKNSRYTGYVDMI